LLSNLIYLIYLIVTFYLQIERKEREGFFNLIFKLKNFKLFNLLSVPISFEGFFAKKKTLLF